MKRTSLIIALCLTTLSACAPSIPLAPGPSASPSLSETLIAPVPDQDPAVLVISGSGLRTETSAGVEAGAISFGADVSELVGFLTAAFGQEAVVTSEGSDDGVCAREFTVYQWGEVGSGLAVRVPGPPADDVRGVVVLAQGAVVSGLAVRASAGFSVGDDVSGFVATLGPDQAPFTGDVAGGGEETESYVYDVVDTVSVGTDDRAFGGVVIAESGNALQIGAPRASGNLLC